MNQIGKGAKGIVLLAAFVLALVLPAREAHAQDRIPNGVYAESVNLSGMTAAEAEAAVEAYIETLRESSIVLELAEGHQVTVTAEELGLYWMNPDLVQDAEALITTGNVIERYKASKDLEHENRVFDVVLGVSNTNIHTLLTDKCLAYDQDAVDYKLSRVGGEFVITEGQIGYKLDIEASAQKINTFLTAEWTGGDAVLEMVYATDVPRGGDGSLAEVGDVLGTFTTSYKSSGSARSKNIANGTSLIDGTTLYPGDELDTLSLITPFSEANGYYLAGSYLNGQVVESLGGGICQVSTTLYNAVLLAELEVTLRYNHSMIISYVEPSMDAAIAESSGKNFKFVNNTDYPIYVEGITTPEKKIIFTIYGKETRDTVNRQVSYESETLETTYPDHENVIANEGLPFGFIDVTGAHIGIKARLWKIVTENGVQVSREEVNRSNYTVSPATAVVGVATDNEEIRNAIMGAVASGSIDACKAVIAAYTAPPAE